MRKKQLKCVAVSEESFCYNGNFLNENKRERLTAIYIHVIRIMKYREIIKSFLESVLLLFLLNSLLASIIWPLFPDLELNLQKSKVE